jgi:hypothetical protein
MIKFQKNPLGELKLVVSRDQEIEKEEWRGTVCKNLTEQSNSLCLIKTKSKKKKN